MNITVASSTAGRIGQLVRLLGSDKSGEIVAAATALKRALRGAGLDLHSLAEVTERALIAVPPPHELDDDALDDTDLAAVIRFCLGCADELTDRERMFVADMDRLARRLGNRLELTPKQEVWLLAIFDRVRGAR
ncbi:hypothetical protein [Bradyrhizobium sp. AZCC 2289]|uniref:hypothetical protein n=1 Tax=Bradyrhizobium sp. AZCC 2289 TaxID=3117026 RepID=UPI002FF0C9ED